MLWLWVFKQKSDNYHSTCIRRKQLWVEKLRPPQCSDLAQRSGYTSFYLTAWVVETRCLTHWCVDMLTSSMYCYCHLVFMLSHTQTYNIRIRTIAHTHSALRPIETFRLFVEEKCSCSLLFESFFVKNTDEIHVKDSCTKIYRHYFCEYLFPFFAEKAVFHWKSYGAS